MDFSSTRQKSLSEKKAEQQRLSSILKGLNESQLRELANDLNLQFRPREGRNAQAQYYVYFLQALDEGRINLNDVERILFVPVSKPAVLSPKSRYTMTRKERKDFIDELIHKSTILQIQHAFERLGIPYSNIRKKDDYETRLDVALYTSNLKMGDVEAAFASAWGYQEIIDIVNEMPIKYLERGFKKLRLPLPKSNTKIAYRDALLIAFDEGRISIQDIRNSLIFEKIYLEEFSPRSASPSSPRRGSSSPRRSPTLSRR